MKLTKPAIALLASTALIIVSGAWYLESPAWTLSRMKAAAESSDPDALSSYIDYPALREDLKAEVLARLVREARKDKSGVGGLGLAIGSAMIGPLIDGMVSPAGVRAALIAKRNEPQRPQFSPAPTALMSLPEHPMIVRRSFSEFLVATKDHPNSGLVFKLHGLSWKLSGVDLPPS